MGLIKSIFAAIGFRWLWAVQDTPSWRKKWAGAVNQNLSGFRNLIGLVPVNTLPFKKFWLL